MEATDMRCGRVNSQALSSIFAQVDESHRLSGTVLVAHDRDVVFEQAYGFASHQLGVGNGLNTKFAIASLTKMVTALTVLVLAEQGQVELGARPAAYVPELAGLDGDITLHHLLSHTSGLRDVYDVPHLPFEVSKLRYEGRDLLAYLAGQPHQFRPGDGWGYSSTGYLLLGYILERVTGSSFADVLTHYVLAPLAMASTGVDRPRRINPGRAAGHDVDAGQVVNADHDELSPFASAPGELYSTIRDLKRWSDAMFDCPLVSPRSLERMFTPHGVVGPSLQYGYGWFLAPRFRTHGGGTPGFVSRIRQYPAQQVSIVLLFNSTHVDPDAILDEIDPLVTG
jgi:CubicO group peptidase (beta-lactamase class C family)